MQTQRTRRSREGQSAVCLIYLGEIPNGEAQSARLHGLEGGSGQGLRRWGWRKATKESHCRTERLVLIRTANLYPYPTFSSASPREKTIGNTATGWWDGGELGGARGIPATLGVIESQRADRHLSFPCKRTGAAKEREVGTEGHWVGDGNDFWEALDCVTVASMSTHLRA